MPQTERSAWRLPAVGFSVRAERRSVKRRRYHRPVTETAVTVGQQLEEIRARLAWVRDYL